MDQVTRKPTLTPPQPASDEGFEAQSERWPAETVLGTVISPYSFKELETITAPL